VGLRLASVVDATVPTFTATVVLASAYEHAGVPFGRPGCLLTVAACLALAGRRRAPLGTVALTAVLALAVALPDPTLAPHAWFAPAAALMSLALTGPLPRRALAVLGTIVVGVGIGRHDQVSAFLTVSHLALIAVPILATEIAAAQRSHRLAGLERLSLLSSAREHQAERRVQEERLRIARDLHDVVAHTLTTINVQAAVAGHLLATRPERAHEALAVIEDASREAINELRALVGVLRDPDGGAPLAPTPGLAQVPDLVARACAGGMRALLDVRGEQPARVPEALSHAAFRIVQESLTNAARHTGGADVRVELTWAPDELAIAVRNPLPAAPAVDRDGDGVGIIGMTERAEALGGSVRAAADADGFLVTARLPYVRS
jgi:signal transduction histidine kinase